MCRSNEGDPSGTLSGVDDTISCDRIKETLGNPLSLHVNDVTKCHYLYTI